ncbi:hypothetical protein BCR37DRAFT_394876 [Protomyces lactucae-debilis]|uniref:Uncharacterized protein n=1 Tax=Protomyces lactucae-debilis TaxID=2754530 RepID=A0A1Y2F1Q5_PROLT|nr:uncharacterized protein BCR37DRAFT_394876 [Protomyces lactucae-debilis]ORY77790.1 hypothetical protein BCR37DRAFT_394876 [Protomyces lactucae-debilis]
MRISNIAHAASTLAIASALALPNQEADIKLLPATEANPGGLAKIMAFLFANDKGTFNNNMPETVGQATKPTSTSSSGPAPQPGAIAQVMPVNMTMMGSGTGMTGSSVSTSSNTVTTPKTPNSASGPPTPAAPMPAAGPVVPPTGATINTNATTKPVTASPVTSNTTRETSEMLGTMPPITNTTTTGSTLTKRAFPNGPNGPNGGPAKGFTGAKPRPNMNLPPGMVGMVASNPYNHPLQQVRKRDVPDLSREESQDFGMESLEAASATPPEELQPVLTSPAMDDDEEDQQMTTETSGNGSDSQAVAAQGTSLDDPAQQVAEQVYGDAPASSDRATANSNDYPTTSSIGSQSNGTSGSGATPASASGTYNLQRAVTDPSYGSGASPAYPSPASSPTGASNGNAQNGTASSANAYPALHSNDDDTDSTIDITAGGAYAGINRSSHIKPNGTVNGTPYATTSTGGVASTTTTTPTGVMSSIVANGTTIKKSGGGQVTLRGSTLALCILAGLLFF